MTLGSIVKQARTSAGVSIEALAEQTKIRPTLLREIENNDFTKCGGDAYARGHLGSIARALGVAPSIFIEHFNLENPVEVRTMNELLRENSVTAPVHERSKLSLKALSLISAAAVFMVAGGQVVYTSMQPAKPDSTKSLIASSTPSPAASENASDGQSNSDIATTAFDKAVNVQISATRGDSWLSVNSADGTKLYAGKISIGQSVTYSQDTPITIRFGNAGAVDVLVNGKATPTPGAMGEVVNVIYGATAAQ
jgi:cytoskeleton protein RodZ